MWICEKCEEENEDSFDSCWKCSDDTAILEEIEKDVKYEEQFKINLTPEEKPNQWHYLIIFLAIWILTLIIDYIVPAQYSGESFAEAIGFTFGIMLVAFLPYWLIKLITGFKNIILYFIPIISWLIIMYLIYFQYY